MKCTYVNKHTACWRQRYVPRSSCLTSCNGFSLASYSLVCSGSWCLHKVHISTEFSLSLRHTNSSKPPGQSFYWTRQVLRKFQFTDTKEEANRENWVFCFYLPSIVVTSRLVFLSQELSSHLKKLEWVFSRQSSICSVPFVSFAGSIHTGWSACTSQSYLDRAPPFRCECEPSLLPDDSEYRPEKERKGQHFRGGPDLNPLPA